MKGAIMKQKNSLCKALHHLKPLILIVTAIAYSLCLTDISWGSASDDMIYRESPRTATSGDGSTSLLEETGLEIDPQQSINIIFPNGEGVAVTIIPFSLAKIDSPEMEILLQNSDTLANTIVVSDTCEVIGIIAILLAAACLIFPEPILCTIATVMQGLFRLLCQ
jgi:hypothetical protein